MQRATQSSLLVACAVLILGVSGGCYPRISPIGPVVKDPLAFLAGASSAEVDYAGLKRRTDLPILPLRLWGVEFAEEMLFVLKGHPRYAMIEVCHVRKRNGEWTWFALVAEHSGRQHVAVAGDEDYKLGQSFPAPVYRSGLRVERTEEAGRISYITSFGLPDGQVLDATVQSRSSGTQPGPSQRNGSAMNHSQQSALAIIDLKEFSWARPIVTIDGNPTPVRSLAPGLSYAMRLEQVAGGIAAGLMRIVAGSRAGEYALHYGNDSGRDPMTLTLRADSREAVLSSADEIVDLEYRFRANAGLDGPLELHQATVRHGSVEAFDLRFSPPLPDFRYPFTEERSGRLVAGVAGRDGYMVGTYVSHGSPTPQLLLLPSAPFWACERPIHSAFELGPDQALTRSEVRPDVALDGAGAAECFSRR